MEIFDITVSGFRNISKTTLSLSSITALVGLNGYGKSNVVDAINFGFDFIHGDTSSKTYMMGLKDYIPLLKQNAGDDYSFQVHLDLTSDKTKYFIEYGFSFSWETDHSSSQIKSETLRIKEDGFNKKYNTFISRDDHSCLYKTAPTGRCSKNINVDSHNLVLNKLMALDDLYYLDIINQINSTQFFVERHLDARFSFVPDPMAIKGFQELELKGIQSIPRAIYFLKRDYTDKYNLLINAFQQLFPSITNINVEEFKLNQDLNFKLPEDAPFVFTDSVYYLSIVDNHLIQPIGFQNLSDGTQRVFLMLTYAVIADIKNLSLIAIEEPENSIHPSLFQEYLDILNQLVNNCKIIVTSHSPYIIQYLDPSNIYIGIDSKSGTTNFNRIAPSKIKSLLDDATEFDSSLGNYIFNLLSSSDGDLYLQEYITHQ